MSDTGRRRGRPPLKEGEKSTSIKVRVSASDYDRISRLAIRSDLSMSKVFRFAVHRLLQRGAPSAEEDDD